MLLLALLSILYGSAQAFTQTNARLILGYSSMAQLGFITLGIFALGRGGRRAGRAAADGQPRARGRAAVLHHRAAATSGRARRTSATMGGIAFRAPVLAALFLIVALATLAMPGSANFVGEFLILLGLFNAKLAIAIIAFTGVALASVYMLRMFIRTMHNRVGAATRVVRPERRATGSCSCRSCSRSSRSRSIRSRRWTARRRASSGSSAAAARRRRGPAGGAP